MTASKSEMIILVMEAIHRQEDARAKIAEGQGGLDDHVLVAVNAFRNSIEEAKQRLIMVMEDSGSERLDVALMALNNAITEMEQASAAMSNACYQARASLAHAEEREQDFIAILAAI